MIYLDNAATTPMDKRVVDAMMPFMTEKFGNPSAIHNFGRENRAAIEKARKVVASCINAVPAEIFFTSGGTESNNMALKCAVKDYQVKHVITSSIEHHCVEYTLQEICKDCDDVTLHLVNLKPDGHIDLEHLQSLLNSLEGQKLVSLMYANNELGNVLDVEFVAEACDAVGALFHTDTVQAVGHFPINVRKTKVHFLSGSGHKFHGPKGIGFLFINENIKIAPLIHGGSQERNMRAGTENIYGIVGLGKAIELAYEELDHDIQHITGLKSLMKNLLIDKIPGVKFNGDTSEGNLYTVLNVSLPPTEMADTLIYSLDMAGIAASAGSACSSGSNVGSHVLKALDYPEDRPYLRFSFSKFNTEEEISTTVNKLAEILGYVNAEVAS